MKVDQSTLSGKSGTNVGFSENTVPEGAELDLIVWVPGGNAMQL